MPRHLQLGAGARANVCRARRGRDVTYYLKSRHCRVWRDNKRAISRMSDLGCRIYSTTHFINLELYMASKVGTRALVA